MSLVVPLEEIFASGKGVLSSHPSWKRVELGEVCTILNGFPFKSSQFNKSSGFPIIRIRDLGRNRTETFYDGDFPREYIIHNGDLLVGMDGIFRCCEWHGGEAGLNQRVCKITPNGQFLNRKFLLHALNGYLKAIEDATSSVTVGHLSSRDILRIPFPLPPIEEQNRLAEKLDELTSKVGTCTGRLERIPTILKRFRQSVLAAACSGGLTADWRESASKEQLKLAEIANPKRAVPVDTLFDVPDYWSWLPLEALCNPKRYICYGVIKLGPVVENGVHCLRTSDVKPLRIDTDNVKTIDPVISDAYRRTVLQGDEILVNVRGTLGGVAVVPNELRGWNISREVALVPVAGIINQFAAFWIASMPCQNWLTGVAKGVAYTGINIEDLRLLPIALPSIEEQQEIVRRVESLFTLADQLGVRYKKGRAYVDKLTQSILAKAFRGELVPQDPTDEPAEKLLERIRAEKLPARKGRSVQGEMLLP